MTSAECLRTRAPPGGTRGLLKMLLPLARLRPDIVQFEWNIAAVDHLPLFRVWGCPIVTSCRGSDVTVYPHVPYLRAYADRLPEVLRHASAVHCVSESRCTKPSTSAWTRPRRASSGLPSTPKPFGPERTRARPSGVPCAW